MRCEIEGFLPENSSSDVLSGCFFVERRLSKLHADLTASAQRWPGRALSISKLLVMSSKERLRRSSEEYRVDSVEQIPVQCRC